MRISNSIRVIVREARSNSLLSPPRHAVRQPYLPSEDVPSLLYNMETSTDPWQSSVSDAANAPVTNPHNRKNIAEILFTSGTTSEPRGVVLTHGNFLANLEPSNRASRNIASARSGFIPCGSSRSFPSAMSSASSWRSSCLRYSGLPSCSKIRLIPGTFFAPSAASAQPPLSRFLACSMPCEMRMQQEIDTRGWRPWFTAATAACAGENFYRRAWRFRRLHRLLGWKFWAFISGGAALSSQTEEFFMRIGFAVVQGYGMTETASVISLNHPFQGFGGNRRQDPSRQGISPRPRRRNPRSRRKCLFWLLRERARSSHAWRKTKAGSAPAT